MSNSIKKNLLLTILLLFAINILIQGQVYNPIYYNYNGTPTYGIKIKTNLPFVNSSQMPTIIIEGYNYGQSRGIGLILTWYIYDGIFWKPKVSSFGADIPKILLSNENSKVVIYIDERSYFQRFTIRAFAQGIEEQNEWFTNWQTADEPLTGSNTVEVPYENSFKGTINLPNGTWTSNGNVGVGTTIPGAKLEVYNTAKAGHLILSGNDVQGADFSRIDLDYCIRPINQTIARISSAYLTSLNGGSGALRFYTSNSGVLDEKMRINANGNVSIGTTSEDNSGAMLTVKGSIHTNEVIVDLKPPLADFVFNSTYKLMPLNQVEQFVKTNNHLPEIPSADEVSKNGLSIGEMQNKLLQKVEELTLYVIQLQKTINQQNIKIEVLEKK